MLIGILIGLGRMSSDGEIVAMRAAGVSSRKVIAPVLLFAALGMGLSAWASLRLTPYSYRETARILNQLMANRLGRTVLITNHRDWTAEQVVAAYSGQQHVEQVFRGLKDGEWLGWGPMVHWTVHAFYCMLGISLLQQVRRQAEAAWPGLSTEELLDQLRQIQKYTLLYPPQGGKGPNRVATVLSKQTLTQQRLAQVLGLEKLGSTQRG